MAFWRKRRGRERKKVREEVEEIRASRRALSLSRFLLLLSLVCDCLSLSISLFILPTLASGSCSRHASRMASETCVGIEKERGERRGKGTGERRDRFRERRDRMFPLDAPPLSLSLFLSSTLSRSKLLTWSASLSGWPSLTDSEVKRKVSSSAICLCFVFEKKKEGRKKKKKKVSKNSNERKSPSKSSTGQCCRLNEAAKRVRLASSLCLFSARATRERVPLATARREGGAGREEEGEEGGPKDSACAGGRKRSTVSEAKWRLQSSLAPAPPPSAQALSLRLPALHVR